MKKGDIILIKGNAPISKLIKLVTKSEYSHSAIYIGNNQIVEAAFGGVMISDIDKYSVYDIYRLENVTKTQIDDIILWAINQIGAAYDFLGMFGILYCLVTKEQKNPWDDKDAYWCSELICDAIYNANVDLGLTLDSWTISPEDLARCVELVFKESVLKKQNL